MLPSFIKITVPPSFVQHDEEPIKSVSDPAAETKTVVSADESASLVSSVSDFDYAPAFRVKQWDRATLYSDMIRDGLRYLKKSDKDVVMLFESPSTSNSETSFFNSQTFKFHDYPPAKGLTKTVLGPCRYSVMNGSTYPSYLMAGAPTKGLVEHWHSTIPGFVEPRFVKEIPSESLVYAYLPCESIINHVIDPHSHYHLAGKDALPLMTKKTPKLLNNTATRPCIAKTTHSMGSKGIFVIRNDEDEAEFQAFLVASGNPTFVVTELIEIDRNVACHFFIHPSGEVTLFGSNENHREEDGRFSLDSYLIMAEQAQLREMQLPFIMDIVAYCQSLGYWGLCGIDVLFDKGGQGYLVDLNPRVTGSCPSLMVAHLLKQKYGFEIGLFRRSGPIYYPGSIDKLYEQVNAYNQASEGQSKIVLFAVMEVSSECTKINIGVYGNSLEVCKVVINRFAKPEIEAAP